MTGAPDNCAVHSIGGDSLDVRLKLDNGWERALDVRGVRVCICECVECDSAFL